MKLTEILDQWKQDSAIDLTNLVRVDAECNQLLEKYLRYYTTERFRYRQLLSEFKKLRLQKFEHYTQGPSEETKHWPMPASGRVLKTEADRYLEADDDLIKKQAELDLQHDKVSSLETILEAIKYRSNLIGSIMRHEQFLQGG